MIVREKRRFKVGFPGGRDNRLAVRLFKRYSERSTSLLTFNAAKHVTLFSCG